MSKNSSNYTSNSSNTLETHLFDTSNILQTQITATSNLIHRDEILNTIIRITAQDSLYPLPGHNPVEIFFQNVNGDIKTKITQSGELMVYHPAAPLPAVNFSSSTFHASIAVSSSCDVCDIIISNKIRYVYI